MTRRAKHRGARLPALFGFHDGQPTTEVDDVPDNPRLRPCPFCRAQPHEPCIAGTRHGRIKLDGYHDSRKQPQENPCPPPTNRTPPAQPHTPHRPNPPQPTTAKPPAYPA